VYDCPSASGRQNPTLGPLDGLEPFGSGPLTIAPVESVWRLDQGGGCAVLWHGRPCDVDGVVCAGRAGRGGAAGSRVATTAPALEALVRELGAEGELLVGQEVGTMTYLVHQR